MTMRVRPRSVRLFLLLAGPGLATAVLAALPSATRAADEPQRSACRNPDLNVVILGSGGPELNDRRASTSYLLREGDRARFLIDFGTGASANFEKARAQIADLHAILFSHFHVDHTNDLPGLIKASFFSNRTRDLPIYGPTGNQVVPDTRTFIHRLFGPEGAYSYLSDFLDGEARYRIVPHAVDASLPAATASGPSHTPGSSATPTATRRQAPDTAPESHQGKPDREGNLEGENKLNSRQIFSQQIGDYTIRAVGVSHGLLPSLAWRIDKDGCSVVFSGDTSNQKQTLDTLVKDVSLFIAHNAVPQNSTDRIALRLHMPPSEIGRIAADNGADALLLSHFMQRTRLMQQETAKAIRPHFGGSLHFARDGDIYRLQDARLIGNLITPPATPSTAP
ncbi:MAG: MBL fold metallo-hydrolase [Lautropia sp.]|nr:MBL fold metallo-hydrolase [Lautropia sp.]